ncbi:hypothetical protein DFP72DRAFT_115953 [Ephemerocybe angulata]|uniref:F-box domain-containing protein n=1 Tax=Ephemerocybe angulata TaxID=980116 RepID=A0A8H6MBE6_9AGAR|nr:hypothetical protein DFP72DRAFT_115953 [Tulosesus angulatus]
MAEKPFATVSEVLATSFTGPATRALVEQYGTPSIPEYKEKLAARILELEHDIRILKTCQNSTPSVNRLPPEVLSNIFIFLFWTMEREYREDHKVFWIRSTHVCRHWRAVALGCAALWTNFAFDMHGELMRTILPRSKNLPLSVTLKCDGATDVEALEAVLSQTTRLRCVELSPRIHPKPTQSATWFHIPRSNKRYGPVSLTAALESMGPSAPLLTTLSVSYTNFKVDESLPEGFLEVGAPALKYLKLDNFDLHWSRIPFSSTLETLHLGGAFTACPEFPAMLETLRGLPRLERLTLRAMLPDLEFDSLPGVRPVTFKKLEYLSLEDSGPAVGNFLGGIRVPKTIFIDIQFIGVEEWAQPDDSCVKRIKELWVDDPLDWTKDDIYSLQVSLRDDRNHLEFRFGGVPETLDWRYQLDPDEVHPHLTVSFPRYSHGSPNLTFLTHAQTYFDFTMLTTLHFIEDSRLAYNPLFENTFARLPNIQVISFVGCDMSGFWHIMDNDAACNAGAEPSEPSPGAMPPAAVVPFFPALQVIEMSRETFNKKRIDDIIRVLNKRPSGHRLGTLQIYDCINLDETDVARIMEGIPGIWINWDDVVTKKEVNMFDELYRNRAAFGF